MLGAVGLAGRSSRRQGQLAGTVPPPRPAWWDGVSHVVTRPARLDHLNAVGSLEFRWTTVFREPGRLFSGFVAAFSLDHSCAVGPRWSNRRSRG